MIKTGVYKNLIRLDQTSIQINFKIVPKLFGEKLKNFINGFKNGLV